MAVTPNIPAVGSSSDPAVRRAINAIRDYLMHLDAVTGGTGGAVSGETIINNITNPTVGIQDPGTAIPLVSNPTGQGLFDSIMLTWDSPGADYYWLAKTEIYWSLDPNAGNDVENDANLLTSVPYPQAMFLWTPPDTALSTTYYFWLRYITISDRVGGWSAMASATTADNPAYLKEVLAGEITESELFSNLTDGLLERIDLTDNINQMIYDIGQNATDISTESQTRSSEDEALATSITTVVASFNSDASRSLVNSCTVDGDAGEFADMTNVAYFEAAGRSVYASRIQRTSAIQHYGSYFRINPADIYEVKCSVWSDGNGRNYLGVNTLPTTSVQVYHVETGVLDTATTNPYWWYDTFVGWKDLTYYLCGPEADYTRITEGMTEYDGAVYGERVLVCTGQNTEVRLRFLGAYNESGTTITSGTHDYAITNVSVKNVTGGISGVTAAVQEEATARAGADDALAEDITTLSSSISDTEHTVLYEDWEIGGTAQTPPTTAEGLLSKWDGPQYGNCSISQSDGGYGLYVDMVTSGSGRFLWSKTCLIPAYGLDDATEFKITVRIRNTETPSGVQHFGWVCLDVNKALIGASYPITNLALSETYFTFSASITMGALRSAHGDVRYLQPIMGLCVNGVAPILMPWVKYSVKHTSQTAALQIAASARASADGAAYSQYTVKTDVNGKVAGFGLMNDGATSDFGVLADRFYVAHPSTPWVSSTSYALHALVSRNGVIYRSLVANNLNHQPPNATYWAVANDAVPFIVSNGNVYMNTAYIEDATITNAHISDLSADKIKTGTVTAGNIITGMFLESADGGLRLDMVAQYLKMTNSGQASYNKDTSFEMSAQVGIAPYSPNDEDSIGTFWKMYSALHSRPTITPNGVNGSSCLTFEDGPRRGVYLCDPDTGKRVQIPVKEGEYLSWNLDYAADNLFVTANGDRFSLRIGISQYNASGGFVGGLNWYLPTTPRLDYQNSGTRNMPVTATGAEYVEFYIYCDFAGRAGTFYLDNLFITTGETSVDTTSVHLTSGDLLFNRGGIPYKSVKRILTGTVTNGNYHTYPQPFMTTPTIILSLQEMVCYDRTLATTAPHNAYSQKVILGAEDQSRFGFTPVAETFTTQSWWVDWAGSQYVRQFPNSQVFVTGGSPFYCTLGSYNATLYWPFQHQDSNSYLLDSAQFGTGYLGFKMNLNCYNRVKVRVWRENVYNSGIFVELAYLTASGNYVYLFPDNLWTANGNRGRFLCSLYSDDGAMSIFKSSLLAAVPNTSQNGIISYLAIEDGKEDEG